MHSRRSALAWVFFVLAILPGVASSQLVGQSPVGAQEPRHTHQLEDETVVQFLGELTQVITDTSRDLASHSLYVQIFISVIVALFGAASIFLQIRSDRRQEDVQRRLEQQLHLERTEFAKWKIDTFEALRSAMEQRVAHEVERALPSRIESLIKDKYEAQIEERVLDFSKEVLMRTPEVRGFLLARLRRMIADLVKELSASCGESAAREISVALSSALQDWHTLGQLFSPDHDDLEKGLLAARANPFLETVPRLRRLRARHSADPKLVPLLDEALLKIEDLQSRVAV